MIITDSFVMLNYPKTGSEFARKMIVQAYKSRHYSLLERVMFRSKLKKKPYLIIKEFPNIRDTSAKRGFLDEHGIYKQIPNEHRGKQIISIRRDIYDRYISLYEFRDWVKSPWLPKKDLDERFDNYEQITFSEFLHLLYEDNPREQLPEVNRKLPIGPATSQFILFFFKEPFKILRNIDDAYMNSDQYKEDMAPIKFLKQSHLNEDIFKFLKSNGFKEKDIEPILNAPKINNSTPIGKSRDDYFTPDLYDLVNNKERFLFKILNDLDD
ncbi:sulfotransferase domain-containing protein [uncultured Psychroserpens sp.]|uniref:sulfotransferase domain-containing protein n=1 Tax=uncultured Psychroserpens sp. TaxID=255436 RepID=UPI002629A9BB|nr:sulfotransferase domain-containing protein [uncultured Psychroserpens sp.]